MDPLDLDTEGEVPDIELVEDILFQESKKIDDTSDIDVEDLLSEPTSQEDTESNDKKNNKSKKKEKVEVVEVKGEEDKENRRKETSAMAQYNKFKKMYPNFLLMFMLGTPSSSPLCWPVSGDFYEMFNEDAEKASQILDITVRIRTNGWPDSS